MGDSATVSQAMVVQTQEEERYRLARTLQEGPGQLLANAALEIETCLRLMNDQPDAAREGLTALLTELRQGYGHVRDLIAELQPPLIAELGLSASLQQYTEAFARRTGIRVGLRGWDALVERFPATIEMAIFRIVQEALDNVREHARAKQAQVALELTQDQLTVTISDNGAGFDPSRPITAERRLGLVAMRDRAELLGGNLQVFSEPGHGVRVVLTAPVRKSHLPR
ncbi:MAG: sensor histidine kinase [Chloroflexota bacterium]|nr:sensor histidine kinase [Chloroflexota bacterium]